MLLRLRNRRILHGPSLGCIQVMIFDHLGAGGDGILAAILLPLIKLAAIVISMVDNLMAGGLAALLLPLIKLAAIVISKVDNFMAGGLGAFATLSDVTVVSIDVLGFSPVGLCTHLPDVVSVGNFSPSDRRVIVGAAKLSGPGPGPGKLRGGAHCSK